MQETLGWEDLLEKGTSYPLQYSGMENSMDYIVHGVAKSWTQLSDFHFHFSIKFFFFCVQANASFTRQLSLAH